MRNYDVAWREDTMPGRGVVAYDKRHDDVVITGFQTHRMRMDRARTDLSDSKQHLNDLEYDLMVLHSQIFGDKIRLLRMARRNKMKTIRNNKLKIKYETI